MNPSQVVVESLRAHGVTTIFGLDGDHIVYLYDALADAPDIQLVTVKHENTAAIAAEVYGRLTGTPGIALTTAGPGATNALSGVAGAYAAAAPVIHLCGGVADDAEKEAFHGVDDPEFLRRAFEPVTKWSARVASPHRIAGALEHAFHTALAGRPGAVHLEIPLGVLNAEVDLPPPAARPATLRDTSGVAFAEDRLAALVERIDAAGSIAIVAGKNAWWPIVSERLVRLAERLHAPVAHTWDGLGAMPTVHPLSAGAWGRSHGGGHPIANRLVEQADLVLGIGVRRDTGAARNLLDVAGVERVVLLDAADDPSAFEVGSIAVLADLLATLADRCRERPEDAATLAACHEAHATLRRGIEAELARYRDASPWHIAAALHSLAGRMSRDTLVVTDVSQVKMWAPLQLPIIAPESQLQSGSWGAMGYVIPGVLAAALARPEKKVVGLVGDASFLMASSDFVTICELGLPVVIAVHADRQIGMIYATLTEKFGRAYATEIGAVDFVRYAEAFGATGLRVDDVDDIDAAWEAALAADGPVLLELRAGHRFPRPYPIARLARQGGA